MCKEHKVPNVEEFGVTQDWLNQLFIHSSHSLRCNRLYCQANSRICHYEISLEMTNFMPNIFIARLSIREKQSSLQIQHSHPRTQLKMHIYFSLIAIFLPIILADGPCVVDSDNCRAVINASACFNKFLGQGNKANVLSCLAGTEGDATPTVKVRLKRLLFYSLADLLTTDVRLHWLCWTDDDSLPDEKQSLHITLGWLSMR
jgi:hypothetical protein